MGFEDEVDEANKETRHGGGYYTMKEGDNKLRILTEPKKKVSRWGYGICYEGAPYCSKEQLEKEYQEKIQAALAEGKKADDVDRVSLSIKFMCWAWDIADNRVVLLEIPLGIANTMIENKKSEEAGWDGWPMPYGINIKAKGAGKKTVKYELINSRTNSEVPEEIMAELEKQTPVEQILEKQKAKQKEKVEGGGIPQEGVPDYPEEDINPEDIPF